MVSAFFFLTKLTTFFSHRPLQSDVFSPVTTTTYLPRRLSSILSQFSHKNNFSRVSPPPSDATGEKFYFCATAATE